MPNLSGIKKVNEIICSEEITIYDKPKGGRERTVCLDEGREYIVPEYQREIKWSTENVQTLIDDLRKGSKFLGTITFSTSKPKEFEIIDGQQRLTVITMMINCINEYVEDSRKVINLCNIRNKSFPYFKETLLYKFDFEKIKKENQPLYNAILTNDNQNQRKDFARIWKSITERVETLPLVDKEKLLLALCESELNVIVNEIEGTDTQRKFCVDYFIDINNKSVELDSLDIIRAYAFKEDFIQTTDRWVKIQQKCNILSGKVKYTRDELYYQYFLCNVNKEIEYKISKLSNDYKIKEDVVIAGKEFASGTFVWNLFKNDKFYSNLLEELDEYLDFIEIVVSSETGGDDRFKQFFYDEKGKLVDETRILNAHTIINTILRNDDMVPKMMVMKYFFEVLKPNAVKYKNYRIISNINIIATVFTLSTKRKGSEIIASKVLLQDWQKGIREYSTKTYYEVPEEIGFDKINRDNGVVTTDSGLHAARRYFSMKDSCSISSGSLSIDEEKYKNENITSGEKNMEHFIINRDYTYTLFLDDGKTADVELTIPKKQKKNIATIANYLLMNSEINKELKNRPVYEKIDMLEGFIDEKGIDVVLPSVESQMHYYSIKKYMHDESKYPQKKLIETKKKKDREKTLKAYYQTYFTDEFSRLLKCLRNVDQLFIAEMEYKLKKLGFEYKEDKLEIDTDLMFDNIGTEIDEKQRKLIISAELYNPFFEEDNGQDKYENLIEQVSEMFTMKFGKAPEIHTSAEYCEDCYDESVWFEYTFEPDVQHIIDFLDELSSISSRIE